VFLSANPVGSKFKYLAKLTVPGFLQSTSQKLSSRVPTSESLIQARSLILTF